MRLLVTGGTGLVGSALQKVCPDAIYLGSKDYDLTREVEVKAMFDKYGPTHVIHLAARVGGITDNISHPAELIYQNILMNTYVVHYAHEYRVRKLICALSNCAYPDRVEKYPMLEDQLFEGAPAATNFAYAQSKRALEAQVRAYREQYGCNYFSVIPCSVYGPHDNFEEDRSHFLAALIRKIYDANKGNKKNIELLGTGKPLRQYIYSEDLAKILLLLLERYDGKGPVNIAPDENYSIAEIAQIALNATGSSNLKVVFDKSSPDGQYRKDLGSDKLFNIIGNFEFTPLSEGIKETYEWFEENGASK